MAWRIGRRRLGWASGPAAARVRQGVAMGKAAKGAGAERPARRAFGPAVALGLALALAGLPGARAETPNLPKTPDLSETPTLPDPAAAAAADPAAARLLALMQMPDLLSVMAEEGRSYGGSLREAMFPDRQAPGFEATVARIYDPARALARFEPAFAAALPADPALLAEAEAFFAAPLGQRLATAELAARRLLLDEAANEAAEVAAARMQAARDPRLRLIRRLIEAGDLIEQNTAGTMTALTAFRLGLNETAPPGARRDEADILADAWAGEAQVRADSTEWLVTFMALAYADLEEADLKAYAAFLASPAGLAVNRALFAGSEAAMRPALADLGREVGRVLQGHDI